MGRKQFLVKVIVKLCAVTGLKFNIFGYISMGDKVPEVIITVWNLSKTGFIAKEASMQLCDKCIVMYHLKIS